MDSEIRFYFKKCCVKMRLLHERNDEMNLNYAREPDWTGRIDLYSKYSHMYLVVGGTLSSDEWWSNAEASV